MKIECVAASDVKFPFPAIAYFYFEGETRPVGELRKQKQLFDKTENFLKQEKFKGKTGDTAVFYPADSFPATRVIAAGLGAKSGFNTESLRRAVAAAVNRVRAMKQERLVLLYPSNAKFSPQELCHAIAEAVMLSSYQFAKYKTQNNEYTGLKSVEILFENRGLLQKGTKGVETGRTYGEATCLARDLINEPAAVATPKMLAETAQKVVDKSKKLQIRILDEREIEAAGMGALRAVSLGSAEPPRFVHISYKTSDKKKSVAVVGKGITFDAGGLCLKPADGMMDMKMDMSGAAAVIGVMSAVEKLNVPYNVHGIFAATENMPGPAAYKTRDILKAHNGKTIEITNTDAEGRLALADAVSYACRDAKANEVIDIATLTGACMVALGFDYAGVFSNNDRLRSRLVDAAKAAGENFWPLPLVEDYFEDGMKSDFADMKNSGGKYGGAILGAMFIKQFVEDGTDWAHVDIAGPAFAEKGKHYTPAGGTGFSVRSLLNYLMM